MSLVEPLELVSLSVFTPLTSLKYYIYTWWQAALVTSYITDSAAYFSDFRY